MSKETPEVGDVWVDLKREKIFLFMITPRYLHFLKRKWGTSKNRVVIFTKGKSAFKYNKKFEYIGKAKGSIKDLFEVKDESV